ncbi:MAG: DMT family transporter, partial [Pseudomonadota bacterium]|nr:DMT family transporter [Pseudomonadota bacterium]
MLLACFTLSMIAAIGRHAALAGLHPFQTVFLRLLIALVTLLPFVIHAGLDKLKTPQMKLHVIRSANGIFAMWLWFSAVAFIPIDEQTALSFLAPIFTTIGALLFLGEIVRLRRITAIMISLCGALIIVRPGFAELNLGHGLALTSAVAMGVSMLLIKSLTARDSALTITFFSNLLMCPVALLPALYVWVWPDPDL